jgi:hypothetical protein
MVTYDSYVDMLLMVTEFLNKTGLYAVSNKEFYYLLVYLFQPFDYLTLDAYRSLIMYRYNRLNGNKVLPKKHAEKYLLKMVGYRRNTPILISFESK